MANGGEVGECSGPHKPDCEYYMSEGGEIDPSQVVVDEPILQQQEPIDPAQVQVDQEIPDSEVKLDSEKPADYLEQAKAGAEGLAKGLFGDLAKAAEIKSGISSKEAIEQREVDYPLTELATKTAGRVVPFVVAPEIAGSKLVANLLMGVGYAASDNITKVLLDQPGGDPKAAVANTLIDGGVDALLYTLTDGLFSGVKGAKALQDTRIIKAAEDAMIGLAEKPVTTGGKLGAAYLGLTHKIESIEEAAKIMEYGSVAKILQPYIEKIISKPLTKANQYVGDAILNTLIKTDYFAIPAVMRYAQKIAAGKSALTPAIEGLFKSVAHDAHKAMEPKEENVERIREWVEGGGADKELQMDLENKSAVPGYADGGEIAPQKKQAFASVYPTQNIMLNETKARVSGYLNSIRPIPNQPRLPFDSVTPQKDKNKQYEKALRLAASPMSILKHVDKGDLTPGDLKHFTSMYPEVYQHISSEMTKRITKAQLNGEKPTYKKRQAMSLFLGANLDSTFTPMAIQTIQGMFAMKSQANQQQVQKPKKSTSPLSKAAPSAMTDAQARTSREQTSKY